MTFYLAAALALVSTLLAITRLNAIHALLYVVVSFLAVALIFYLLGAPFIAALEVIIYAGAIVVLFVFVVMLLNLGPQAITQERHWLPGRIWRGPAILGAILLGELVYVLFQEESHPLKAGLVTPKHVGIALYDAYLIGVVLASLLLLAGLVGASHLGRRVR